MALLADHLRTATAGIEAERMLRPDTRYTAAAPGSPWPYFVALLLVMGGTWWLERAKAGRME